MSNSKKLTIAIVTRNRLKNLDNCLKSISKQTDKNLSVLLVDNDPKKSAKKTYLKFKSILNIKYFCEPTKGTSRGRNNALDRCNTQYLAFIDDDCILKKDWSKIANVAIKSNPDASFIQGNSIPQKRNPIVNAQQEVYDNWLKSHLQSNLLDPVAIDTKNLILNLDSIKKNQIEFDTNLARFEDVDLGLQLKSKHLSGVFVSNLFVYHLEQINLFKLLKKSYSSGQEKYLLNAKWNNFDNFNPSISLINIFRLLKNYTSNRILKTLIVLSFNKGFIDAKTNQIISPYTIVIVNTFDKSANQERSEHVASFLNKNGYNTKFVDSQKLFDQSVENILYTPSIINFLNYRLCRLLIHKFKLNFLKPWLFYFKFKLRGAATQNYLKKIAAKIVIFEHPEDYLAVNKDFQTILDLPTIYHQELADKNIYPKTILNKIKNAETNAINLANVTTFHWYRILELSKKINLGTKNSTILNWGTDPVSKTSKYSSKPKIIYLGNLNSDWINPPLLKQLIKVSPYPIDIYSYEKPDNILYSKLPQYKGFLSDLSVVSQYQYGLITFKESLLRNSGFSAKHLLYLSHGLPVLCPETRPDKLLSPATLYYRPDNFAKLLNQTKKQDWQNKHQSALAIADKLNWSKTLTPLLLVIPELFNDA